MPHRILACLALVTLLATSAQASDVALFRFDPDASKKPLSLGIHQVQEPATDFVGTIQSWVPKLHTVGGKSPLRFAFAADWDSDGHDEVVLVRERKKKKGRLDLKVRMRPDKPGSKIGKTLATSWKGEFGFFQGDGRIIALGPVHVEGYAGDDLLIVRQWDDGHQSLEVRRFPAGKKQKMGPPILSDETFGMAGQDEVVGLFGCNIDGDAHDEIVVLRRDASKKDRLDVYELPTSTPGETGPPIQTDLDVTPPDGGKNRSIARLDVDDDGIAEILFQQVAPDGSPRLELFNAKFYGALGPPMKSDSTLAVSGLKLPVFAAFGARVPTGPGPSGPGINHTKPWTPHHIQYFPKGDVVYVYIVPMSAQISLNAANNLLTFPGGATLPVTFPASLVHGATISVVPKTIVFSYYEPAVKKTLTATIQFPSTGKVFVFNGKTTPMTTPGGAYDRIRLAFWGLITIMDGPTVFAQSGEVMLEADF